MPAQPAGDHLARYLDAYKAGQITRGYVALVLGELMVIDDCAVIAASPEPCATTAFCSAIHQLDDETLYCEREAGHAGSHRAPGPDEGSEVAWGDEADDGEPPRCPERHPVTGLQCARVCPPHTGYAHIAGDGSQWDDEPRGRSLVGRLVEGACDDSPCPLVGLVVGQADEDTLEVLWGERRFEENPGTGTYEPFDALRPARDGAR